MLPNGIMLQCWKCYNGENGLNEYAVKKAICKTVKNSKLFEP